MIIWGLSSQEKTIGKAASYNNCNYVLLGHMKQHTLREKNM